MGFQQGNGYRQGIILGIMGIVAHSCPSLAFDVQLSTTARSLKRYDAFSRCTEKKWEPEAQDNLENKKIGKIWKTENRAQEINSVWGLTGYLCCDTR
jgi:hypothetical protein